VRQIILIPLCGLLVVAGAVFALGRSPESPASTGTMPSISGALPSPPSLPPPAPGASSSETKSESPTPATAGLACIQNALGGVPAFAGVTSLRIIGKTTPTATIRPRPLPNNREIGVVFPDRYKKRSAETSPRPGSAPVSMTLGFNGDRLLFDPGGGSAEKMPDQFVPNVLHAVRLGFVHQMLMRLPRELAGVRLRQRTSHEAGLERLAIQAFGMERLRATLFADAQTCVPVAAEYLSGSDNYRVELSSYRAFGGIKFPTVLKYARNGEPWEEEYVSDVQINAPLDDDYFRP
jgi:hypothetical protein